MKKNRSPSSRRGLREYFTVEEFAYKFHHTIEEVADLLNQGSVNSAKNASGRILIPRAEVASYRHLIQKSKKLSPIPKLKKPKKSFPPKRIGGNSGWKTPHGTTWEHIKIVFLDDSKIEVHIDEKRIRSAYTQKSQLTFEDLGFADGRNQTKRTAWNVFYDLARYKGNYSIRSGQYSVNFGSFKQHISTIRKTMRAWFPAVKGDPFFHYDGSGYYRTKFKMTSPCDK